MGALPIYVAVSLGMIVFSAPTETMRLDDHAGAGAAVRGRPLGCQDAVPGVHGPRGYAACLPEGGARAFPPPADCGLGCVLHDRHARDDHLALDASLRLTALPAVAGQDEEVMVMGFAATMIFYHVIGLGVATAVFLSDSRQDGCLPVFRLATAVVFWPLYLPIVLAGQRPAPRPETVPAPNDDDAMSRTISQVEAELETAVASLDGWVEDVLAHEAGRFHELSTAWRAQADTNSRNGPLAGANGAGGTRVNVRSLRGGGKRSFPPQRADSSRESHPLARGSQSSVRGLDGHARVGARAGVDDSSCQIHRRTRLASRGAGGPDRRSHRGHFGRHVAGRRG